MPRKRDYAAEYARRQQLAKTRGYSSYYQQRIAKGKELGLTRSQAAGTPKRTELSARDISRAATSRGGEGAFLKSVRKYSTDPEIVAAYKRWLAISNPPSGVKKGSAEYIKWWKEREHRRVAVVKLVNERERTLSDYVPFMDTEYPYRTRKSKKQIKKTRRRK